MFLLEQGPVSPCANVLSCASRAYSHSPAVYATTPDRGRWLLFTAVLQRLVIVAVIIDDARDEFFSSKPVASQDSDAAPAGEGLKLTGSGLTDGDSNG